VWSDEFEYEGLPNPRKWGNEVGYIRNNEKQYYTEARLENARVENGTLVIESRKEQYQGFDYTSASLHTKHTASWTYGKIEVRAKLPTGRGMWPAIWTLGTNISQVGWPDCGEIDIMENVGYDPDRVHGNIHTKDYNHVLGTNKGASIVLTKPYEQFHVYSIEWFEDKIEIFVDDIKYFTFLNEGEGWEKWPFDQPQYLILNAAVGGGWGGQQGIDDSIFPQKYYIDYVRVYQLEDGSTSFDDTYFFPRFADGPFKIQSQQNLFTSEAIFSSTGGDAHVVVDLFDDSGAPLALTIEEGSALDRFTASSFSFDMAGGQSLALRTLGLGNPDDATLSAGYMRVRVRKSEPEGSEEVNVGGTAVFARSQLDQGSPVLLFESGVPLSRPLSEFSLFMDTIGDSDTGLAIINPPPANPATDEAAPATVAFAVWEKDFSKKLATAEVVLEAGEGLSRFVWQLVDDLGETIGDVSLEDLKETQAVVTVTSDRGVAAMTLRQKAPSAVFPDAVPTLAAFPVVEGVAGASGPAHLPVKITVER
jgi:beta-glucanase (GH16 family)